MKRIAFLLGSALSLGGVLLVSAGPVQAQASACNAEIMDVERQLRSTPITASRSYIRPSITRPYSSSADRVAGPLATSSPTRLGTRLGESLGQGSSFGPGEFRRGAHAVPNGSGEATLPDTPGLWSYNVADTIQSGAAMRGGSNPAAVATELAHARAYSQAGDYRACMNAVREAKRYLR
jgi:hypothetical protein